MKKIIKCLNEIKNEDTGFVHFLKFVYSIGKTSWIHTIITFVLGIFIPIAFDNKIYWLSIFLILFGILDIFFDYICMDYQKQSYTEYKFLSEILREQSSLLKSILIEIENKTNWKNTIFKTVSTLSCEKIYRIFKEVFNCETRVSVEYVFDKLNKQKSIDEKHIKMSARRSLERSTVKKAVPLHKKEKYFSYKIFNSNNNGINILNEDDIKNDNIWFKNPNNNIDVKRYIGIAVSIMDEPDIRFILQIDLLDDFKFGDDDKDDDIRVFIERYLMSYINTISLSYILNLNNKNKIIEV